MKKHFYKWGNRNRPTLVLMHGVGSTGLSFGDLAQNFLNDFHVVSFDLPGHGDATVLNDVNICLYIGKHFPETGSAFLLIL